MSSIDFEVNDQIVGKTKKVKDQLGIIKSITGERKKRQLSILFADNKLRTMSINGIQKFSTLQVQNPADHTSDGPDNEDMLSSTSTDEENNELNEAFIE